MLKELKVVFIGDVGYVYIGKIGCCFVFLFKFDCGLGGVI